MHFVISNWISSLGGPLIVMPTSHAPSWMGIDGTPSDYELSCKFTDYTNVLTIHGTDVLVIGDVPLLTAVASFDNHCFIIRQEWRDVDVNFEKLLKSIDLNSMNIIENMSVNWENPNLIMFDAVDEFHQNENIRFSVRQGVNFIKTFIYEQPGCISLIVNIIENG